MSIYKTLNGPTNNSNAVYQQVIECQTTMRSLKNTQELYKANLQITLPDPLDCWRDIKV